MFYNILIFISILIGILIIIFSLIGFNKKNKDKYSEKVLENNLSIIKKLDISVNNANNTIKELNKLSKNIFEDIDNKYEDLLYIYSIIDEKKKLTLDNYKDINKTKYNINLEDNINNYDFKTTNLNNKDIFDLYDKGLSVMEISKVLNIGQGEINLMLELRKDKQNDR